MESIFTAKKKYSSDIVSGTLDRPKAYDNRRFMWVKVYNVGKTHYTLQ